MRGGAGRSRAVIARSAATKQSSSSRAALDCFASLAMTALVARTILFTHCPRKRATISPVILRSRASCAASRRMAASTEPAAVLRGSPRCGEHLRMTAEYAAACKECRVVKRSDPTMTVELISSQKSLQLLRHGLCRRLVELSGPAFDPRRLDAGDLRGPHHGWRGQAGAREVGDINVARPGRIVGAGDHRHPDQPEWRQLAIGNDQRGAALFGETIGVGERHHDDVEGVEVRGLRHGRRLCRASTSFGLAAVKTWMAGTSPAMTEQGRRRDYSPP